MSKIGLLVTAFECENELDEVLKPWTEYRNLGKDDIIISVVSAQFKAYHELKIGFNNEKTIEKLQQLFCNYTSDYQNTTIQYLNTPDEPLEEWGARNLALKPLLDEGCDLIWLCDFQDEYYNCDQIDKALRYLEKEDNQFCPVFKIEFKNYVGDKKHYIKGFKPNRIWRRKCGNFELKSLYYDNNCSFISNGVEYKDEQLAYKTIPTNIINPMHFSWVHFDTCVKKEKFQRLRWGHCSYKCDDITKTISFCPEYHKKLSIPYPEIFED